MQVVVYSTREDKTVTLEGSFRTLEEVKKASSEQSLSLTDLKITVKETKTVLESDSSLLPEGYSKLTLICTPAKMKSGRA